MIVPNEIARQISNEVKAKLNNQNIYPNKSKIDIMVYNYLVSQLNEMANDEIIINGLCEEWKKNWNAY